MIRDPERQLLDCVAVRDRIVGSVRRCGVLGVDAVKPYGKTPMDEESGCKKFICVFSSRTEGAVEVDASHMAEVQFMPMSEVLRTRVEEPRRLPPHSSISQSATSARRDKPEQGRDPIVDPCKADQSRQPAGCRTAKRDVCGPSLTFGPLWGPYRG